MRPGDVRQWRFRTAGTQVRAGTGIALHNDACGVDVVPGAVHLPGDGTCGPDSTPLPLPGSGPGSGSGFGEATAGCRDQLAVELTNGPAEVSGCPSAVVSLHRGGSSARPVCGGERVAVHLAGAGFLAAGDPGGPEVVICPEPVAEWVVTGVAPGVAVPVGRPVALFDITQGDHLVCRPGPQAPVLTWAGGPDATGARASEDGAVTLPIPPDFRPPEGVPGDIGLSGAVVPVRDGDPSAGLLLLLDPVDGRTLGGHLVRRAPAMAVELAPGSTVGAVACRWSAAGAPPAGGPALPPAGSRMWVQGVLVADPGVSLSPLRALAWALDGDGEPVAAAPEQAGWPQTVVTWWVLLPPAPDDVPSGPVSCVFSLPLPARDGEPGSATTLTPVSERGAGRYGERCGAGRAGRSLALVPGIPGSRRVLRMAVVPARGGCSVALGCTARVHLPEYPGSLQPTGA